MRHQPLLTGRVLGYRAVQVLAYVHAVAADTGVAPSYSMIQQQLGLTCRGDVCRIVKSLEKRGLLSRAGACRVRGFTNNERARHVRAIQIA